MNMNRFYLQEHFWNKGKTIDEIAKELKLSAKEVFLKLKSIWPNWRNKWTRSF